MYADDEYLESAGADAESARDGAHEHGARSLRSRPHVRVDGVRRVSGRGYEPRARGSDRARVHAHGLR